MECFDAANCVQIRVQIEEDRLTDVVGVHVHPENGEPVEVLLATAVAEIGRDLDARRAAVAGGGTVSRGGVVS